MRIQRPGDLPQLLREFPRLHIDTDADHHALQLAAFDAGDRLGENAADLFSFTIQVVDPFDL